jgi:hypothetical protein
MEIGVAILGSAGLFGFIQFLISRHDVKQRDFNQIKTQLNNIENKCDRNELATTRLQLFFLIETQPDNIDAIETTAERYFIELGGNGEAWASFHRWAEAHKVDTGWYKALLAREKGNK